MDAKMILPNWEKNDCSPEGTTCDCIYCEFMREVKNLTEEEAIIMRDLSLSREIKGKYSHILDRLVAAWYLYSLSKTNQSAKKLVDLILYRKALRRLSV